MGLVGDRIEFSIAVGYGGSGTLNYIHEDIEDASGQTSVPSSTLSQVAKNEGMADIDNMLSKRQREGGG